MLQRATARPLLGWVRADFLQADKNAGQAGYLPIHRSRRTKARDHKGHRLGGHPSLCNGDSAPCGKIIPIVSQRYYYHSAVVIAH